MISRSLEKITLVPGETGFRIVVGVRASDDDEGTDAYTTREIRTPAAVQAAIALRDAVLAAAVAGGKPLGGLA